MAARLGETCATLGVARLDRHLALGVLAAPMALLTIKPPTRLRASSVLVTAPNERLNSLLPLAQIAKEADEHLLQRSATPLGAQPRPRK